MSGFYERQHETGQGNPHDPGYRRVLADRDHYRALNAELVTALKGMNFAFGYGSSATLEEQSRACDRAEAALAKAQAQS